MWTASPRQQERQERQENRAKIGSTDAASDIYVLSVTLAWSDILASDQALQES
jgi:hypothetical protein